MSSTSSCTKDCHGLLRKCCIVKQNEFSISERTGKIKGLIEKQRSCLFGNSYDLGKRGGSKKQRWKEYVTCSYWQRTNNIQGIVLMQVIILNS